MKTGACMTVTKILVATDFGAPADAALACARMFAERFGATLHLLHVAEDPLGLAAGPDGFALDVEAMRDEALKDAERHLAPRCATTGAVTMTSEVVFGSPAEVIPRVAEERGADLVVVGTHGRGLFSRLVLGSVAEHVVRHSPCPVLTVRGVPQPAVTAQTGAAAATA